MKSYEELVAEMEAIQLHMIEAKKNERTNALKEVTRSSKKFDFVSGTLVGAIAEVDDQK